MSRRLLSAAAATVLLLGLAACDGGKEGPVTTAPPSIDVDAPSDGGGDTSPSEGGGTETETEDPTASAPDIPAPDPADFAGMDEHTEDGAMQALRYYVAAYIWAHQTGDDTTLLTLQADSCEGCKEFNSDLAELQKIDSYWSNFEVTDVEVTPHDSDNFDYEIGYSFSIPKHTRPDLETGDPVEQNRTEYTVVGGMKWVSGDWIVGGLNAEWGEDVHE